MNLTAMQMTSPGGSPPLIDELQAVGSKRCSLRSLGRGRPFYGDREVLEERAVKRARKKRVEKPRKRSAPAVPVSGAGGVGGEGEGGGLGAGKSDHQRVIETLRMFNVHYLHLVQEEEERVTAHRAKSPKTSKIKHKGKNKKTPEDNSMDDLEDPHLEGSKVVSGVAAGGECAPTPAGGECAPKLAGVEKDANQVRKRPDLKAISKMADAKTVLYPEKRIGHIPGIDVGQQFLSRAEMVVVGLHSHWLNGIDYMGTSYGRMEEFKDKKFPLAVCIVLSGMYEDSDKLEDVTYTGQGGHDLNTKKQTGDQKMERGNLALKNNMLCDVPVRVVRGHVSSKSYCGKVYTYDGLYKVCKYWGAIGDAGYTIYKYNLKRLDGQPPLTTNQVFFKRGQAPPSISDLPGLVCQDITNGMENYPIPATNVIDDPPVPPTGFVYHKSLLVAKNLEIPIKNDGCKCKGDCTDPRICSCAKLNGSNFPYVHRDGGRLIEAKAVVFECGPNCGCNLSCVNRTSQQGLKFQFEVFRTPNKGWAVRSWDTIPAGSPICEYTGTLQKTDEVECAPDNNYIFDIDCEQTMKGLDGRARRAGDVSLLVNYDDKNEGPEYCIDAGPVGNIARFINHSCQPNLFVQCVLSSHQDMKRARVMLFAADNIPALQELTYDYGYALDSVVGADGNVKRLYCHCGSVDCRKRLY